MVKKTAEIGQWETYFIQTDNGGFWSVRRLNRKWCGGYEYMMRKDFNRIRFKTQEAAEKIVEKANAGEAAQGADK